MTKLLTPTPAPLTLLATTTTSLRQRTSMRGRLSMMAARIEKWEDSPHLRSQHPNLDVFQSSISAPRITESIIKSLDLRLEQSASLKQNKQLILSFIIFITHFELIRNVFVDSKF